MDDRDSTPDISDTPRPTRSHRDASMSNEQLGWTGVRSLRHRRPYFTDPNVTLFVGDAAQVLADLPDGSVDCMVTSPPYWGLRDYGVAGQYGHEPTVEGYVANLRRVFGEAGRVLAPDGTLWLNLGDTYGGSWNNYVAAGSTAPTAGDRRRGRNGRHRPPQANRPRKGLIGVPWRVVLALAEDGWILRNAIVWHKPNGKPESARDRLARRHELLFLLVRSPRYWFDLDAIREPVRNLEQHVAGGGHGHRGRAGGRYRAGGRNPGDVWTLPPRTYRGVHTAVGTVEIPLRCVAAGCRPGGVVCDPFSGTGTTGVAALQLGRRYLGIDLNPAFHDLAVEQLTRQYADRKRGDGPEETR